MVSWFVKQALLDVARDLDLPDGEPTSREGWAGLMRKAGVQGIHIAERDTQRARDPKPRGVFVNTWSVEGFVSEKAVGKWQTNQVYYWPNRMWNFDTQFLLNPPPGTPSPPIFSRGRWERY